MKIAAIAIDRAAAYDAKASKVELCLNAGETSNSGRTMPITEKPQLTSTLINVIVFKKTLLSDKR